MDASRLIGKKFEDCQSELGLSSIEFRDVGLEKSTESEYSVLSNNGEWELILDSGNRISTIFLFMKKGHQGVLGITSRMTKKDIVSKFGRPLEEADAKYLDGLGEYGAWEKYDMEKYILHIQHDKEEVGVKQITLTSATRDA